MIMADGIKNSTEFFWLLPVMYADDASLSFFRICVPVFFFMCCRDVSVKFFMDHMDLIKEMVDQNS